MVRLEQIHRPSAHVVSDGNLVLERRIPYVTAVFHPKRREYGFLQVVVERLTGALLHRSLQKHRARTRIAESFPGSEVDDERLTIAGPIGKSGAMAQHNPRRDLHEPRVTCGHFFWQIRSQRLIQFQLACVHQLKDAIGEDRLAERTHDEPGVGRYWL